MMIEKDAEQKSCNVSHKNDNSESEISSSKAIDAHTENESSITSNREHFGSDDEDDIFNRNQNKTFKKMSFKMSKGEHERATKKCFRRVSLMYDDEEAILGRNQDFSELSEDDFVCSDSEEEILRETKKLVCSDHKKDENDYSNNQKKIDTAHKNEQEVLGRGSSLRGNEGYSRDQQNTDNHINEELKHHMYHSEKGSIPPSFPSTDKYTIEQPGLTNGGSSSRLQNNHISLFTNNQPMSYLSNSLYSAGQNAYQHPSMYQLGVMGYSETNDKHLDNRQHVSTLKSENIPDWAGFPGAKSNYQKSGVLHQNQASYTGFPSASQNYNAENVSTSETLKANFSSFHSGKASNTLPQTTSAVSSVSNPLFTNSSDSSYFSPTVTSVVNNASNSAKLSTSFSTTATSNVFSTCQSNSMDSAGTSILQQVNVSSAMQFPPSGMINTHYPTSNGQYFPQNNPMFPEPGMAPFTQSSILTTTLASSISSTANIIQSSTVPATVPQSSSPFKINNSPQKSNIVSLHPNSQRYHQIFFYQHQLLIMQFQQYQFQLQLQFQQLNQQQMAQQQQFLLQQQFHQQLMLLQQQLVQQQVNIFSYT